MLAVVGLGFQPHCASNRMIKASMSQKTPAWIRVFLHGNLADDKFTDISRAAVDSFAPPTDRQCGRRAVIKMQISPCLARIVPR